MFNKLEGSAKRSLNYFNRGMIHFLADETFLSVRTELILSMVLVAQIIAVSMISGNLIQEASQLTTLQQTKAAADKRVGQIQDNLEQIKKMPQAAEDLLERLPTNKDNYNLLEKLNSAAGTNQVSLLSVNFLPTKNSSMAGLAEQPVEIRLQGNFENVFLFLDELEKNKRPILTDSLEISTNDKILTTGVVETNVVLRTFLVSSN